MDEWVWEGEILPAAPARCGNNEEASTYEVRSGPMIRVGSRSRSRFRSNPRAGAGCSGAQVGSQGSKGRAGCEQARQVRQAAGGWIKGKKVPGEKNRSGWLAGWVKGGGLRT